MRIYLDTNVFVMAVEHVGEVNTLVQKLMDAGERHPGLLVTSELTLAEALVRPFQLRRDKNLASMLDPSGRLGPDVNPVFLTPNTLAGAYADLVVERPGLEVVPVDRTILILSAFHRADDKSIKLPDAIHLAAAEQSSCTHIVSADRGLRPSPQFPFERVDLELDALRGHLADLQ
jgi:predicted nucleic acid-binding protein